jgi:hypothetical protein
MRTSLNDIQQIEDFLMKRITGASSLLFEARILTQPELKVNVTLQQKVHHIVKMFHRKKLKQETEQLHRQLFTDPAKADFQKTIFQLFNS